MSKPNKRSMMESEFDLKDVVIIDNGTQITKIGVSGEDNPRVQMETVCGIPKIVNDDNLNNKV